MKHRMPKMDRYIIRQGWFLKAGQMFHWPPNAHPHGCGLPISIMFKDRTVIVVVENLEYKVDIARARNFVRKFNSTYMARNTLLGVFTKTIMEPFNHPKSPEVATVEKPFTQKSLF